MPPPSTSEAARASRRPSVSLLLPNFNTEHVLGPVLRCLEVNTTYSDVEVVAVDDGSSDGSLAMLRDWRDSGALGGRVRLLEKENSGAVDTLNTALRAATGDLCVQLDSDASVRTPGWIERMVDLMSCDERVGVVTAKIVMDDGDLNACGVNLVHPGGMHERSSRPVETFGRRRWHHHVIRSREGEGGADEDTVAEVDAGIGCCMMYRRTDALAVGGYDAGYSPVWFDDADLCLMIRRLGRKVFYTPEVRVIHHLQARGSRVSASQRLQPSRLGRAVVRRTARMLPASTRTRLERRLRVDFELRFDASQRARLRHHSEHWRAKWGWDPLNPDMDTIAARWGATEIWWARDAARRRTGEEIVRAYAAAHRH